MNNVVKMIVASGMLLGVAGVQAEQVDITVTANIDPSVSMTQVDGSALPASISMKYKAGVGLNPYTNNVKLWSNSTTQDINVKLVQTPKLLDINGQNPIELAASLNGTTLTTTDSKFAYATLFPQGITGGSVPLPLTITQKDTSAATISAMKNGSYSGMVSMVVSLATAPK